MGGLEQLRDFASASDADAERALLAAPAFARLYSARAMTQPMGSLASELRAFQAFYGLVPNFFPLAFLRGATPLEFAACLLAYDHDLYHVLCQYETSDHDEIALQSFLCGQAPSAFGCFVSQLMHLSNLGETRFKHLRDVLDAPVDREAFERGQRAISFLSCDFAALAERSVLEIRCLLAIAPRPPRDRSKELQNTCGGKRTRPYFAASSGLAPTPNK